MALIGNVTLLARQPIFRTGGTLAAERSNFNQSGRNNNFFFGEGGFDDKGGLPGYGYNDVYGWQLPWEAGGVASRYTANGSGTLSSASVAGGVNGVMTNGGTGLLTSATAQLVVSAVATITGSGSLSSASALAFINGVATITGSGSLSNALSDALYFGGATLSGSSSSSIIPYALGNVEIDITPFTELSPQSLADSVWSSLTASYQTAGTMGLALSDAGGAGNPWASLTASNTTVGTFGKLVQDMNVNVSDVETATTTLSSDIAALEALVTAANLKIEEMHQLQGLELGSPMTVTPTSRTVGSVSLTISGDGTTTTTVERN